MRIIRMSVEDYLKASGFTEAGIELFAPRCVTKEVLRDVLDTIGCSHLWDYDFMDLDELIDREEEMQSIDDWKNNEDTYAVLFDRLWEVEQ